MLSESLTGKHEDKPESQLYDIVTHVYIKSFFDIQTKVRARFEKLVRSQVKRFHSLFDEDQTVLHEKIPTPGGSLVLPEFSDSETKRHLPKTVLRLRLFSYEISKLLMTVYVEVMETDYAIPNIAFWREFTAKCEALDTDLSYYNTSVLSDKIQVQQTELDRRENDVARLINHIETFPALLLSQGDNGNAVHDAAQILRKKITSLLGVSKDTGVLFGQAAFADDIQGIVHTLRQLCAYVSTKHKPRNIETLKCKPNDVDSCTKEEGRVVQPIIEVAVVEHPTADGTLKEKSEIMLNTSMTSNGTSVIPSNKSMTVYCKTMTSDNHTCVTAPSICNSTSTCTSVLRPDMTSEKLSNNTFDEVTSVSLTPKSQMTQVLTTATNLSTPPSHSSNRETSTEKFGKDKILKEPESCQSCTSTSHSVSLPDSTTKTPSRPSSIVASETCREISERLANWILSRWSPTYYSISSPVMSFSRSPTKPVKLSSALSTFRPAQSFTLFQRQDLKLKTQVPERKSPKNAANVSSKFPPASIIPSTFNNIIPSSSSSPDSSIPNLQNSSEAKEIFYSTASFKIYEPDPKLPLTIKLRTNTGIGTGNTNASTGAPAAVSISDGIVASQISRDTAPSADKSIKGYSKANILLSSFAINSKSQHNCARKCLSAIINRDIDAVPIKSWSDTSIYSKQSYSELQSGKPIIDCNDEERKGGCMIVTTVMAAVSLTILFSVFLTIWLHSDMPVYILDILDSIVDVRHVGELIY